FSSLRVSLNKISDFIIVRCNGDDFIEFELSNICNARCVFCPYPDMLKSGKKFMYMSSETLEIVKAKTSEMRSKLFSFTPTTGDTLLHPEWDLFIGKMLRESQVGRATIFTNAIELDSNTSDKLIDLIQSDTHGKLSQVYFSVGGMDAEHYKLLYAVDRFNLVVQNISVFLSKLKKECIHLGIHIHVKLTTDTSWDPSMAKDIFNQADYPYVYFSHSDSYFSNDSFKKHGSINYYPVDEGMKE